MARKRRTNGHAHRVDIELKASDIARAGAAVTFKVRDGGEVLGTVEIGQGSFRWKGAKKQKFKRISWPRLADRLDSF